MLNIIPQATSQEYGRPEPRREPAAQIGPEIIQFYVFPGRSEPNCRPTETYELQGPDAPNPSAFQIQSV